MFRTILILLMGIYISVFSQTLKVTDSATDSPLVLVTVMSKNPLKATITNSKGEANLTGFKNSKIIEIKHLGYKTKKLSYNEIKKLNYKVSLIPSPLNMEEVVVSAHKWQQSSGDLPVRITQITPKDIQLQNPQTAADLLGISGEVFIQKSQQGGGSPMIRGFATNRLLYSVDGIRMNTAIFRAGNIQNVINLDPFAIENAEVLFGPGSVIYGSDAIGGVMSFNTLTPQFSLSESPVITGKTALRYSTANQEKTGHFDVNIGWKNFSLVTSLTSSEYDDLKMGSYGPSEYLKSYYVERQNGTDVVLENEDSQVQTPSAYSQINFMQKVRYAPDVNWDLQYAYHYSETSEYGRYDRHMRMRNGAPRYAEWSYGPQKWVMNNLTLTNKANTGFSDLVTMRVAHQFFEESRISRSLNKSDRETRTENVEAYSFNIDAVKAISAQNTLYYGFEYVFDDVTSKGIDEDITTNTSVPGAARYPESEWQSLAVYVNDEHAVTDKFIVHAGLRYNQIMLDAKFDTTFYPFPFTSAEINNGALTGSLGFVYKPTTDWVISSSLSTGFRSPNVDDAGKVFDSEPGAVVVPNPDLESEYAYNADFGIAKKFDDFLKIDLTAYYTYLSDALVRRDYTLNGLDSIMYDGTMSKIQAIQNAANATVYGVQTGIELLLPRGFKLSTDFNYQKGEEELDDGSTSPSRHAAPWFGNTKFGYSGYNLDLLLSVIYCGEKSYDDLPEGEKGKTEIYAIDSDGNPYSPGWYTLNFKASYKFTNGITIESGLENITDQRYRPYSSGIAAAGRNFILAARMDF